jgi:hypothetical protein
VDFQRDMSSSLGAQRLGQGLKWVEYLCGFVTDIRQSVSKVAGYSEPLVVCGEGGLDFGQYQ